MQEDKSNRIHWPNRYRDPMISPSTLSPGDASERLALCVYLASRHGIRPDFAVDARRLGAALTAADCDLVYGGGSVGLMGEVADAVIAGGGSVTGVITEHLLGLEVGHRSVTNLIVVPDMPTRKKAMFDRADGFVIAPGGVGTMEELFEVWCWAALGLHPKALGVLNTAGYYDLLIGFMQRSVDEGLTSQHTLDLLIVDDDPERLVARVAQASRSDTRAA